MLLLLLMRNVDKGIGAAIQPVVSWSQAGQVCCDCFHYHCNHQIYFKQAARLFGKGPTKFHTLEYGAQGQGQALEEPQLEVEVPQELQDGPALLDPHMQRASALNEAGQGQEVQEPEGQARQPEMQENQEVGPMCGSCCPTLCCAVPCRAGL